MISSWCGYETIDGLAGNTCEGKIDHCCITIAGALHTHRSVNAQTAGLCSAWEWEQQDRILHCLPLHHIHGIVNALLCPLAVGAAVECLPKFSPSKVWSHLQVSLPLLLGNCHPFGTDSI